MKHIKKPAMTLALLLAAATGLDAEESLYYGDDIKRNGSVWDESW
jgi:hypothetical protein